MNIYTSEVEYLRNKVKQLEEALAKQEQELALQKLHDENERLGLYKDAYGEEHKESVRLQCVVCNTVYEDGVPPQVAKQEQGEPVAWRIRCTDPMREWTLMYRYPKSEEQFSNIEIEPLYTTPQPAQKPWVGLTDEERFAVLFGKDGKVLDYEDYAEAIEAKLKEKNT